MIINIVNWIIVHKILTLQLVLLAIVLSFVLNFASGNAIAFIQVDTGTGAKNFNIYASSDSKTTKAKQWVFTIIPRDTKSLIVTGSDNIKTQTAISIPWYGVVSKKVPLKQDKNADKVAYRSTRAAACATYMPTHEQLAFYDCLNPKTLSRYQAPDTGIWSTKKVADIYYSANPVRPYLGGVIGITYSPSTDEILPSGIIATTENGTIQPYDMPIGLPREDLIRSRIFTDRNDPTNKRFVIVSETGDIFVGTPETGRVVDYHHIAPPANYSKDYNETLCYVTDSQVFCYRGPFARGEYPDNFDFDTVTPSQVITYSFDSGSESFTNISQNFFAINGYYVTRDGKMFIRKDGTLSRLIKQGNMYVPEQIAQDVSTAVAGQTLHYAHKNGVFSVDPNDTTVSHQVFYSSKIIPLSIYTIEGKVYVIGTRKGSESISHAYMLNDAPNTTPGKRLIDLVPIDRSENKDSYYSDLVGDRMYISLSLSNRSPTPEQFGAEFTRKKDNILNYFNSYGLTVDESKITFGR